MYRVRSWRCHASASAMRYISGITRANPAAAMLNDCVDRPPAYAWPAATGRSIHYHRDWVCLQVLEVMKGRVGQMFARPPLSAVLSRYVCQPMRHPFRKEAEHLQPAATVHQSPRSNHSQAHLCAIFWLLCHMGQEAQSQRHAGGQLEGRAWVGGFSCVSCADSVKDKEHLQSSASSHNCFKPQSMDSLLCGCFAHHAGAASNRGTGHELLRHVPSHHRCQLSLSCILTHSTTGMSRASVWRSEQVLEGMMEGVKEEVESLTRQLQGIRQELAPGESAAQRCQSTISVATSERDLLLKRGKDAAKKLQVIFMQTSHPHIVCVPGGSPITVAPACRSFGILLAVILFHWCPFSTGCSCWFSRWTWETRPGACKA